MSRIFTVSFASVYPLYVTKAEPSTGFSIAADFDRCPWTGVA